MTSAPQLLDQRRLGAHQPHIFNTVHCTRRLLALSLSVTNRFDKLKLVSNVNDLAFEIVEHRYLLTGQADASLSIYDTAVQHSVDGAALYKPCLHLSRASGHADLHEFGISSVCWYPVDTGLFFTAGLDKRIKIWDTNLAKVVDEQQLTATANQIHASHSAIAHNLLGAAMSDGRVLLFDLLSGSATHTLKGHVGSATCVRWSNRSGYLLASAGSDGRILMWDIRTANQSLALLDQFNGRQQEGATAASGCGHSSSVCGIEFTQDGCQLLSIGNDRRARLWNVDIDYRCLAANYGVLSNKSMRRLQPAVSSYSSPMLAFLPNDSSVAVCNAETGQRLRSLIGHYSHVTACCLNPLKQELYSIGLDRNLLLWQPEPPEAAVDRARRLRPSVFARTAANADVDAANDTGHDYYDQWSDNDDDNEGN